MNLPTMNMLLRKFDLWQKKCNVHPPFFIFGNILQNQAENKHSSAFLKLLGENNIICLYLYIFY